MRRTTPNTLDHAILSFGRAWYGYGGGSDEDIYVEFGVDARTYFQRLRQVLASPAAAGLAEDVRAGIESTCRARLSG